MRASLKKISSLKNGWMDGYNTEETQFMGADILLRQSILWLLPHLSN